MISHNFYVLKMINFRKSKDFHGQPNEKIVGGDVADPNSIPYQVSFQFFGSHGCGGSVINEVLNKIK